VVNNAYCLKKTVGWQRNEYCISLETKLTKISILNHSRDKVVQCIEISDSSAEKLTKVAHASDLPEHADDRGRQKIEILIGRHRVLLNTGPE
jgi:hypothetical protein